jgi:hypothetical protein
MSPDGVVIGAGTIAFVGSMREAQAFPPNGVRIIVSTGLLAIAASIAGNGPLRQPVTLLAWLMVITALIRYVPYFNTKKGK